MFVWLDGVVILHEKIYDNQSLIYDNQSSKGNKRVRNDRDVMFLLAHDVTVIVFSTFKTCTELLHSVKYFDRKVLIFCCQCPLKQQ